MENNTGNLMILPVYAVHDWPEYNDLDFVGSGTLIRFHGRNLLLTAAHVLRGRDVILLGGLNPPVPLRRPQSMQYDSHNNLDVDLIDLSELTSQFVETPFKVIDWDLMMKARECEVLTSLCKITGFPAHSNMARQDTHMLTGNVVDVEVKEDVAIIRHTHFKEVAANRDLYIGLRYEPFRLVKSETKRPKVKAFNGLSGGSIWQMGMSGIWQFGGIVTDCQSSRPTRRGERLIIGIRTEAIDSFLRARM